MGVYWQSDGITWRAELITSRGRIICKVKSKGGTTGYTGLIEYFDGNTKKQIAFYNHIDDLDTARRECEKRAEQAANEL